MSRLVDGGAIFAGWVGLGMALVLAMAFELIIPVQVIVFLLAPLMGVIIGLYANVRSVRWRPRGRVLANAGWAGLVTGVGIAVVYIGLRLVFLYGDTGALPTGSNLSCDRGPDCTYTRYVEAGRTAELHENGITDAATFEAAILGEFALSGTILLVLTVGGSLVGGALRAASSGSGREEIAATA